MLVKCSSSFCYDTADRSLPLKQNFPWASVTQHSAWCPSGSLGHTFPVSLPGNCNCCPGVGSCQGSVLGCLLSFSTASAWSHPIPCFTIVSAADIQICASALCFSELQTFLSNFPLNSSPMISHRHVSCALKQNSLSLSKFKTSSFFFFFFWHQLGKFYGHLFQFPGPKTLKSPVTPPASPSKEQDSKSPDSLIPLPYLL